MSYLGIFNKCNMVGIYWLRLIRGGFFCNIYISLLGVEINIFVSMIFYLYMCYIWVKGLFYLY